MQGHIQYIYWQFKVTIEHLMNAIEECPPFPWIKWDGRAAGGNCKCRDEYATGKLC